MQANISANREKKWKKQDTFVFRSKNANVNKMKIEKWLESEKTFSKDKKVRKTKVFLLVWPGFIEGNLKLWFSTFFYRFPSQSRIKSGKKLVRFFDKGMKNSRTVHTQVGKNGVRKEFLVDIFLRFQISHQFRQKRKEYSQEIPQMHTYLHHVSFQRGLLAENAAEAGVELPEVITNDTEGWDHCKIHTVVPFPPRVDVGWAKRAQIAQIMPYVHAREGVSPGRAGMWNRHHCGRHRRPEMSRWSYSNSSAIRGTSHWSRNRD